VEGKVPEGAVISVYGRHVHMVDDEHVDLGFGGLEFEAELLLERCEDGRRGGVGS